MLFADKIMFFREIFARTVLSLSFTFSVNMISSVTHLKGAALLWRRVNE